MDISLYERGQHTNTLPFYLALLGTRFRARFRATGKRRHMEIRLTACGKPSYGLFPHWYRSGNHLSAFGRAINNLKAKTKKKSLKPKLEALCVDVTKKMESLKTSWKLSEKSKNPRSQRKIGYRKIENILKTAGFILFFLKKIALSPAAIQNFAGRWGNKNVQQSENRWTSL